MAERSDRLARTFVDAADTLVADFDIVDFLTVLTVRCVELFDLAAAGLVLSDAADGLRVAASSNDRMQLLELFELQYDEGPCLDSYRSGEPVRCDDLVTAHASERWPAFVPEARSAGYASVYALPMRLRQQVIGSLNLLGARPQALDDAGLKEAQALADVATIGILQHRAAAEQRLLAQQLQYALQSRILVEQAKGILSEYARVDMDDAFGALRRYARDHNERLVDVADALVERQLPANNVIPITRSE
jgi:transcriptional regulator with GAF, ATPase, and Fis domain